MFRNIKITISQFVCVCVLTRHNHIKSRRDTSVFPSILSYLTFVFLTFHQYIYCLFDNHHQSTDPLWLCVFCSWTLQPDDSVLAVGMADGLLSIQSRNKAERGKTPKKKASFHYRLKGKTFVAKEVWFPALLSVVIKLFFWELHALNCSSPKTLFSWIIFTEWKGI